MNKWTGLGRVAGDPEIRYTQGDNSVCVANYRLAVNGRRKDEKGNYIANWINIRAIGKAGEFAEKYLRKGMRIAVSGEIVTDHYTNKDGKEVYIWYVLANEQEFAESKGERQEAPKTQAQGFQPVKQSPFDGYDDGELPFV